MSELSEDTGPMLVIHRMDLSLLSERERQVVDLLRDGKRLSQIAAQMAISNHTARNHLKHVFVKLKVHSQIELLSKLAGPRPITAPSMPRAALEELISVTSAFVSWANKSGEETPEAAAHRKELLQQCSHYAEAFR